MLLALANKGRGAAKPLAERAQNSSLGQNYPAPDSTSAGAEKPLCALAEAFAAEVPPRTWVFSMLSVLLKCPHRAREQFTELRMLVKTGVISLRPLHVPFLPDSHKQLLPVEGQVPVVFELIS